jgi:hypothetical protein
MNFKFGVQIPKSLKEAIQIDKENGNCEWQDAIQKEIGKLFELCVFNVLKHSEKPPTGYQRIPTWMHCDLKFDGRKKGRFLAGGHVTKDPEVNMYSSVASREIICIAFLLVVLNQCKLISMDIGNAYVNAACKEKVFFVAGPEFGPEME